MTDSARGDSAPSLRKWRIGSSQLAVWAAFLLVHLALGLLNLYATGLPLGDVTIVYKFWMDQATAGGIWVGVDTVWVYPILALLPMIASTLAGPDYFGSTWLTMVLVLNAIAFAFLTGWGRPKNSLAPAWWWVAFLALLGPIAMGRIDAITIPFALVGVLLLASRPGVAAVLLTIATWIKVWPAALIAAALIALRSRLTVLAAAILGSAVIMIGAMIVGAGPNLLSFITQQTGRGLQVESPVSTIWMWLAAAGLAHVDYDREILTFQVYGPGAEIASAAMTPLLIVAVVVVAALGLVAVRRGVSAVDLFAPLALALTVSLIAFNKVGSPQFVSWLAVPVIAGLMAGLAGQGRSFRTPAVITLVIAGLTQVIYPYLYNYLLWLHPLMLIILTARNVLYFVLLAWAITAIRQSIAAADASQDHSESWIASVWPFSSHHASVVDESAESHDLSTPHAHSASKE